MEKELGAKFDNGSANPSEVEYAARVAQVEDRVSRFVEVAGKVEAVT